MAQPAAYHLFVGVDIAARSFTAAWGRPDAPLARPVRYDQTAAGFAAFQAALTATDNSPAATLIVMEATSTSYNKGEQFRDGVRASSSLSAMTASNRLLPPFLEQPQGWTVSGGS